MATATMTTDVSAATAFVPPPQCVRIPNGIVCLGGPDLEIEVKGRVVLFEMHNYFGPHPLNKRTLDPMERIPSGFYDAIERWGLGGKLVNGSKCVTPQWCATCAGSGDEVRMVTERVGEIVGKCKACDGKRIRWEERDDG